MYVDCVWNSQFDSNITFVCSGNAKLTGDNLKVVWAEFFALGLAVYPDVRKVH
jgi:hypothetical protein